MRLFKRPSRAAHLNWAPHWAFLAESGLPEMAGRLSQLSAQGVLGAVDEAYAHSMLVQASRQGPGDLLEAACPWP